MGQGLRLIHVCITSTQTNILKVLNMCLRRPEWSFIYLFNKYSVSTYYVNIQRKGKSDTICPAFFSPKTHQLMKGW